MAKKKKIKKITKSVSRRNYSSFKTHSSFQIKLSESYLSLILGFFVVIAAVVLFINFSKNRTYDHINTAVSTYQELTTPVKEETSNAKTYGVKNGDTLWSIAEKVYGSGYNWIDLAKANKLENPSLISAGTKLIIPDVPKITVQASENVITNSTPSITSSLYTIQKGDSLWEISVRKYGDGYKWPEIAKANNLTNPNFIYSENILYLPR